MQLVRKYDYKTCSIQFSDILLNNISQSFNSLNLNDNQYDNIMKNNANVLNST